MAYDLRTAEFSETIAAAEGVVSTNSRILVSMSNDCTNLKKRNTVSKISASVNLSFACCGVDLSNVPSMAASCCKDTNRSTSSVDWMIGVTAVLHG